MSDAQTTRKNRGRTREPAKTARGRAMLAHIDALGLTLKDAAKRAGISFYLLYDAIHARDPRKLRAGTVAALVGRLGMPLRVVSREVADAIQPEAPTAATPSPSATAVA